MRAVLMLIAVIWQLVVHASATAQPKPTVYESKKLGVKATLPKGYVVDREADEVTVFRHEDDPTIYTSIRISSRVVDQKFTDTELLNHLKFETIDSNETLVAWQPMSKTEHWATSKFKLEVPGLKPIDSIAHYRTLVLDGGKKLAVVRSTDFGDRRRDIMCSVAPIDDKNVVETKVPFTEDLLFRRPIEKLKGVERRGSYLALSKSGQACVVAVGSHPDLGEALETPARIGEIVVSKVHTDFMKEKQPAVVLAWLNGKDPPEHLELAKVVFHGSQFSFRIAHLAGGESDYQGILTKSGVEVIRHTRIGRESFVFFEKWDK